MELKPFAIAIVLAMLAACGGKPPPPKAPEPEPEHKEKPAAPVVEQELGSIDETAVEQTFRQQDAALENCHTTGRARIEYLAGDVKVFLRIDKEGKVRWAYFEDSSLGDRETEKCVLDALSQVTWPAPVGGQAEVRHGFGWEAGQERGPVAWDPEKVTQAIDAQPATKRAIEQCKAGITGALRVTGYVADGSAAPAMGAPKKTGKGGAKTPPPKDKKKGKKAHFRAIGVASQTKEAAEKADCIVDALKDLELPSPGSYAAKVSFTL